MNYKETKAPVTTVTYDKNIVESQTENIYEAISIISKRAVQINTDLKTELVEKLEEFATYNDSLEDWRTRQYDKYQLLASGIRI